VRKDQAGNVDGRTTRKNRTGHAIKSTCHRLYFTNLSDSLVFTKSGLRKEIVSQRALVPTAISKKQSAAENPFALCRNVSQDSYGSSASIKHEQLEHLELVGNKWAKCIQIIE
jgi:hypothetical protein